MKIESITSHYDKKIAEMWPIKAGGTLRSLKKKLVEDICQMVVEKVWSDLSGSPFGLEFVRKRYIVRDKLGNEYGISQDKHVRLNGEFILSIECKAYAEVAMYKRIMVDCMLMQSLFPDLKFCLFQFESMLGGDYSSDPSHTLGSPSVNVINSFFPSIDIEVVTLLDGERDINREIHKEPFYKPLEPERMEYALDILNNLLRPYSE